MTGFFELVPQVTAAAFRAGDQIQALVFIEHGQTGSAAYQPVEKGPLCRHSLAGQKCGGETELSALRDEEGDITMEPELLRIYWLTTLTG